MQFTVDSLQLTVKFKTRTRSEDRSLHFPNGAPLDALFVLGTLKNGVDENTGRMNVIRVVLAELYEFFDFGDNVVGGSRHHGIEVARGLAIDEVAPAIAFPCLDECEITAQAAFENILAAVELAGFFSFGDHGAIARGRVERGNTGATGAEALTQRALGIQFHLQFAA